MEQESSSPGKKTQTHKNRKTNPVLLNSQASLGREIETCLAKAGWRAGPLNSSGACSRLGGSRFQWPEARPGRARDPPAGPCGHWGSPQPPRGLAGFAPALLGAQPGPRLPPRPPRAEGAGGSCRSTVMVWVSQLRSTPRPGRAAAPGKGASKNLPLPRAARGTESLRESRHLEERNPEPDGEVDAFHAVLLIISGITAPR